MIGANPATLSAHFKDFDPPQVEKSPAALLSFRKQVLLEAIKALRNLRDVESIQRRVFSLMFSLTPADCAATFINDSLARRNRDDEASPMAVNRAIGDRVIKEGDAVCVTGSAQSTACVPLATHEYRMGFIYASASRPSSPLSNGHLALLEGVAAIAAIAFEHASHVEVLHERNSRLQQDLDLRHDLVFNSPVMAELSKVIARVAATSTTVLRKRNREGVSSARHSSEQQAVGRRSTAQLLAESLLESELFGHEKGSFTGATAQEKGEFELASDGTLFLDEVGELSLSTQARLLRALQEREIKRIGGAQPIPIDIRLIAATNRDRAGPLTKEPILPGQHGLISADEHARSVWKVAPLTPVQFGSFTSSFFSANDRYCQPRVGPIEMDNANPDGRSAYYEDSPLQSTPSSVGATGSFVGKLLLEAAKPFGACGTRHRFGSRSSA